MDRSSNRYDYIIAGAGSSGLSLARNLLRHGPKEKRILVADRSLSPSNDKTWCFWQQDTPECNSLVYKKWERADIFINGNHYREELSRYPYYAIRSGDYRSAILQELEEDPRFDLLETGIEELTGNDQFAELTTDKGRYRADFIFQSCFSPSLLRRARYPVLQHFLGWDITAADEVFDADSFVLMDVDETYRDGMGFMYILPWTSRKALLEYTIFSREPEQLSLYENKLELYLHNRFGMKRINYVIDRVEYGAIPMEDSVPNPWFAPRVLNLGTQAGLTKASTGYTFRRIQEHSRAIVDSLNARNYPAPAAPSQSRFLNYDLWLLQIIHDHPEDAREVFQQLFANNSLDEVFHFLGEESTFWEDLKIMASVPWQPFFRAIWKTKSHLFTGR